jgi:CRISPR-associated endonuclease Cas1
MGAIQTVHHLAKSHNSATQATSFIRPQHGVLTLFGYGITINVDRGHLIIKDGIAADRRAARLSRVGHGLRRLVVVGSDGFVSLSALRWLADQDVAFVMLERDGSVLVATGPVRPSDARLRRAQSLAHQSGVAVRIARELIYRKLVGQERLVRERLNDPSTADRILQLRVALAEAETVLSVRQLESQAAQAYWSAWRNLPVLFPSADLPRVPDHWRTFGTRKSPLTGSPRLAVNPPNSLLNYLYAVLESEARLAAAALGLDPGMGILHVDTDSRDSLACDLMEPVRPAVDAYVLDWIAQQPLRREWFFEKRDGNCRLMASFAVRLSETAPTWGRAVAPIAEWVCRTLWSKRSRPSRQFLPATRLTESHRREAKGSSSSLPVKHAPRLPSVCRACGALVKPGQRYCASCAATVSKDELVKAAQRGRVASHSREAQARRAETQRQHHAAKRAWRPSQQPEWLTEETYAQKIQPRLAEITVPAISSALGISEPYATDIRAGKRLPHPRHWRTLAQLVGVSPDQ